MVNFSLEGKAALITGASRGIGECIAIELAAQGAHCVLASRSLDALEAVVEKIKSNGGSGEAVACNMADQGQIDNLMKTIETSHGKLDILVNNAAANPYFGEMINAEDWAWEKTLGVNLKAPFFLTQAAARIMKSKDGGAIVNVASINGITPPLMQGIYSITKAGLICMTKAWAKELAADNIRVNALLPGLTETKFSGAITADDELKDSVVSQIPQNRMAQPEEMVGAVLYLVSDASSFTTGSCITCDGGMLA